MQLLIRRRGRGASSFGGVERLSNIIIIFSVAESILTSFIVGRTMLIVTRMHTFINLRQPYEPLSR